MPRLYLGFVESIENRFELRVDCPDFVIVLADYLVSFKVKDVTGKAIDAHPLSIDGLNNDHVVHGVGDHVEFPLE